MCGTSYSFAHMSTVASRDLANHTADVLRQVAAGTRVTITVNGKPVAEIGPARAARPLFLNRAALLPQLTDHRADSRLTDDLAELASDTTDDVDPL